MTQSYGWNVETMIDSYLSRSPRAGIYSDCSTREINNQRASATRRVAWRGAAEASSSDVVQHVWAVGLDHLDHRMEDGFSSFISVRNDANVAG